MKEMGDKMKEKTDLRVIKTKKVLYESLVELLKEKPFEEIKVSDICERALINRSTFYSHYADKYELFSSYIDSLKSALTKELEKNTNISTSKEYYLEMLSLFLNHVSEQKQVYRAIMQQNRNSIIMDMLYHAFNEDIAKKIEKEEARQKEKIPGSFIASFYLGAVLSVGMKWLTNENKYTKKELLKYLDILIPDDLNSTKLNRHFKEK